MSVDLVVSSNISGTPSQVSDQSGNGSALSLAQQEIDINGTDYLGSALPLRVIGTTTQAAYGNTTWGRLIRLQDSGTSNMFYDIGIDVNGNLFINSSSSAYGSPLLSLTAQGMLSVNALAVGGLKLTNLTTPPSGVSTSDVVVDPSTGNLYRQN